MNALRTHALAARTGSPAPVPPGAGMSASPPPEPADEDDGGASPNHDDVTRDPPWRTGGIREIVAGTIHAAVTKHYRVDGTDLYTIEYRPRADGTFKIAAVSCPPDPYGNGPATHHRYANGEICVRAGKEPRTLDRAQAIALLWAQRYSRYIRTGFFSNSGARVNV